MAAVDDLRRRQQTLLDNPDSFANTAGYRFGMNQALQGAQRGMSSQRGSGNVLAALAGVASGYAGQQRGAELDRIGSALGREQGYDLGLRADTLGRDRLGLDTELGRGQLSLGRDRLSLDDRLGSGRLALDDRLGTGQLNLGRDRLGWDREYGRGQLDNNRRANDQQFGLGMGRLNLDDRNSAEGNSVNWFNAMTNRGNAESNDWNNRQRTNQNWYDRFF